MSSPVALTPAPAWTLFFAPDSPADKRREVVLDRRFKVIEKIGSGGMGSVFLCEDLDLRSRAAVKVLHTRNADARRRFVEEATLLANLRHPHLVQVLAVGEAEDGSPYMAMEHLGRSLDRRLVNGEPLPWREVVEIAAQVADALTALHRAGVVHRDVKPSNIAELRGVTGRVFVKLIDLGVARVDDLTELQTGGDPLPPRRPTEEGKVVGTPGFVPPEAGLCPATPTFDVYGLGVTIFRLCTGVMPDPLERKTMREVRPALGIPEELDAVVARAMKILPEDRWRSAREFAEALLQVAAADHETPAADLFDDCFELIELLGLGAKAEVYRAYHRDARRYLALKILRDEVAGDREERIRFDREARILAALDHPAVPNLYECRTSARRARPFIAMELRRGVPAADFGLEPLPVGEVIEIGRQLADALVVIHSAGVIHRDLNRTNVLIERFDDARPPQVSIIDFGQAELTDAFYAAADERYPTPPEARTRLGSGGLERAGWTAPEARAGAGWTAKSDVYSLGLLLHLLLTGKRPTRDHKSDWVSPADLVPECEGPLAEAILSALQVDPRRRLDAAGLRAYLDDAAEEFAALQSEVGGARPAAVSKKRTAVSRKNSRARRWSVVGFLLIAAGVAALWMLVSGLGPHNSPPMKAWKNPALVAVEVPAPVKEEDQQQGDLSVAPEVDRRDEADTEVEPRESDEAGVRVTIPDRAAPTGPGSATRERAERSSTMRPRRPTGAALRRQLDAHRDALDDCLRGSPPVEVELRVASSGRVTRVDIEGSSPLVRLCLRDTLSRLDLGAAERSGVHRITLGDSSP